MSTGQIIFRFVGTVFLLAVVWGACYLFSDHLPDIPEEHAPEIVTDWQRYGKRGPGTITVPSRVTVVVFSDYACPHCATAASTMERLVRGRSDKVEVVWRHLPQLSGYSFKAAIASECARRVDRFGQMHEKLFSVRDSLGSLPWTRLASEVGIPDTTAFATCLSDSTIANLVRQDSIVAQELGIKGIPGVLVDSLLFRGVPPFRYLRAYVGRVGFAAH